MDGKRTYLRDEPLKRRDAVTTEQTDCLVKLPVAAHPAGLVIGPDGGVVFTVLPPNGSNAGRDGIAWRRRTEWVAAAINAHGQADPARAATES